MARPVAISHGLMVVASSALTLVLALVWRFGASIPIVNIFLPRKLGVCFSSDASVCSKNSFIIFLLITHFASSVLTAKAWQLPWLEPCLSDKGTTSTCGNCKSGAWKTEKVMGSVLGLDVAFSVGVFVVMLLLLFSTDYRAALGGVRGVLITVGVYTVSAAVMRSVLEATKLLFDYETSLLNTVAPSVKQKLMSCDDKRSETAAADLGCNLSVSTTVLKRHVVDLPQTIVKLAHQRALTDTAMIMFSAFMLWLLWYVVNNLTRTEEEKAAVAAREQEYADGDEDEEDNEAQAQLAAAIAFENEAKENMQRTDAKVKEAETKQKEIDEEAEGKKKKAREEAEEKEKKETEDLDKKIKELNAEATMVDNRIAEVNNDTNLTPQDQITELVELAKKRAGIESRINEAHANSITKKGDIAAERDNAMKNIDQNVAQAKDAVSKQIEEAKLAKQKYDEFKANREEKKKELQDAGRDALEESDRLHKENEELKKKEGEAEKAMQESKKDLADKTADLLANTEKLESAKKQADKDVIDFQDLKTRIATEPKPKSKPIRGRTMPSRR